MISYITYHTFSQMNGIENVLKYFSGFQKNHDKIHNIFANFIEPPITQVVICVILQGIDSINLFSQFMFFI